MRPVGLFVGLCTLDVIQLIDRMPAPDEKVVARDVTVAAGGPAANAAVAFASLGGTAVLLTRLGDDEAGRIAAADLAAHGVTVVPADEVGSSVGTTTTIATILVTNSTGERAVVSTLDHGRSAHLAGAADSTTSPTSVDPGVTRLMDIYRPDVILVDSHEVDLSLPICRDAAARSIPVVLDCGAAKSHTPLQLPWVSAAVVSEAFSADGADAALLQLRTHGARFAAVTAGGKPIRFAVDPAATPGDEGATCGISSAGIIEVPSVRAVDTLGAGDFFHGALAFAIARDGLTHEGFVRALTEAAQVASRSVQSFGTRTWLADSGRSVREQPT